MAAGVSYGGSGEGGVAQADARGTRGGAHDAVKFLAQPMASATAGDGFSDYLGNEINEWGRPELPNTGVSLRSLISCYATRRCRDLARAALYVFRRPEASVRLVAAQGGGFAERFVLN